MSKLLRPNPELADLIHKKCSGLSNWYGLVPELFPNVKYIYGIMTGSMEPYLKKLRHYAGEVPLVSADYGSSEGWIGANVNPKLPPELATYVVLPNIGYFEFIPIMDNIGPDTKPLGLTEVEIGKEYEILVTNFAGIFLSELLILTNYHSMVDLLNDYCFFTPCFELFSVNYFPYLSSTNKLASRNSRQLPLMFIM